MSKSRICPVCENEIPDNARFLCPHCHFELKWLDDELAIENAKQNFPTIKIEIDKAEDSLEKHEGKYYVSGLIGSAIPGFFVLVLVLWSLGMLLWAYALPVWLLGGFSAGLIGTSLEKENSDSPGLITLTIFLGFVIASIIGILMIFFVL